MSFVFPLGNVGNSTQTDLAQGWGDESLRWSFFLPTEKRLSMLGQIYVKGQEIWKEWATQSKVLFQTSPVWADQYKSSCFNMARACILTKNEIWAYLYSLKKWLSKTSINFSKIWIVSSVTKCTNKRKKRKKKCAASISLREPVNENRWEKSCKILIYPCLLSSQAGRTCIRTVF